MSLTAEEALRAYARMLNTSNLEVLSPLLADNIVYESQTVLTAIGSKADFLEYMTGKIATYERLNRRVFAEMARLPSHFNRACVVIAQDHKNNPVCTVLAEVSGGKISRIDLCLVPAPADAVRTGEYPA